MSLLMDALRKAEQAKRQAESASARQPNLELEPTPAESAGRPLAPPPGAPLPELPSKLELLDDQFGNVTSASSAPRAKAGATAGPAAETVARERQAAQQIFAAKEPQQPSRRGFYLGLTALTLVAASGIAGYFWWQLQPRSMLVIPASTARAPAAPVAESQPPAAAAVVVLPAAGTAPRTATPAPEARPLPASSRTPGAATRAEEDEEAPAPRPARALRPGIERGQLADGPVAAAPVADATVRISRSRPQADPALERGYRNFQSGSLSAARSDYEQALRRDPNNTDALNGLAAIAQRGGEPQAAEAYYLRALEADPQDATAQAGLLGLRSKADPVQAESRLKSLAAAQPDTPGTHFALGNLYASQGRWHEAQQAYFRAHTGDPENPDYRFNLAVSLDQLRQPRLALQYYQGALNAAASRAAAFDQAQAVARVRELQQP